jgi:hypothetical protein
VTAERAINKTSHKFVPLGNVRVKRALSHPGNVETGPGKVHIPAKSLKVAVGTPSCRL